MWATARLLHKLSLKGKLRASPTKVSIQPQSPARTRFAPSPTGFLHLGSLRTALYNYLLAKSTGGQFLLRLEDTDRNRLVDGAEKNIYESLDWTGIVPDEGPTNGGPFGPYRQSERMHIYKRYAEQLVESGHAYKCYCSKDRLVHLRESAMALKPPTTVTYDRKCLHSPEANGQEYTVRFRSPDKYEPFTDLLHGRLDLQPQINQTDRRYDDFVILKLDGLPTYHFANVVDDHLMKITHVIRGEEWLASTPKHVAMYRAFGWQPPKFVHIPLLTSLTEKKLSKRQGNIGVLSMRDQGTLPEALTNFVALFGWAPSRPEKGKATSEVMTMDDLISKFSLDQLTKGNAKVNDNKLHFFNKSHLCARIKDPKKFDKLADESYACLKQQTKTEVSKDYYRRILREAGPNMVSVHELHTVHKYFFKEIEFEGVDVPKDTQTVLDVLKTLRNKQTAEEPFPVDAVLLKLPSLKKKNVFEAARFALTGGVPGITIPVLIDILGYDQCVKRIEKAIRFLEKS